VKNWRRLKEISEAGLLCSVAEDIRRGLQGEAEFRWQELRAVQAVWREVREQFDGEDPCLPEVGARAEEVERGLKAVLEKASRGRRALEPTEETLEAVRQRVEEALSYIGLRVTRP
jgi:hypothetical protein